MPGADGAPPQQLSRQQQQQQQQQGRGSPETRINERQPGAVGGYGHHQMQQPPSVHVAHVTAEERAAAGAPSDAEETTRAAAPKRPREEEEADGADEDDDDEDDGDNAAGGAGAGAGLPGAGELVPIRLALESGRWQANAAFCWDPAEGRAAADRFAAVFVAENHLPADRFAGPIADSILAQVEDCARNPFQSGGERLAVIEIDFRYEEKQVVDRFVWDVANMSSDVERFAAACCADIGLESKFVPMFAHQIREGILGQRKRLAAGGSGATDLGAAPDGNTVRLRGQWDAWAPQVKDLPPSSAPPSGPQPAAGDAASAPAAGAAEVPRAARWELARPAPGPGEQQPAWRGAHGGAGRQKGRGAAARHPAVPAAPGQAGGPPPPAMAPFPAGGPAGITAGVQSPGRAWQQGVDPEQTYTTPARGTPVQGQERPSGTQEKPSGGASVTQYKKTPAEAAALEAAFAERLRIAKERKQEKGEPQPSAEKPEKGPP
eukprot:jgi/Tetstr1/433088/TSEL_022420.t1